MRFASLPGWSGRTTSHSIFSGAEAIVRTWTLGIFETLATDVRRFLGILRRRKVADILVAVRCRLLIDVFGGGVTGVVGCVCRAGKVYTPSFAMNHFFFLLQTFL